MERISGELARLGQSLQGDLLTELAVDPQQAQLLAHPDLPTVVLRRHGVIGTAELHVSVAVDATAGLFEDRKQAGWQRSQ